MRNTSMALLVAAGLVAGCDKIDALTPPDLPPAVGVLVSEVYKLEASIGLIGPL